MHKSERLNDMMRYLAGKDHFNLRDLMEKYGISRSSALRDVRALEELGMPIFSRPGRGVQRILVRRLERTKYGLWRAGDELHLIEDA